MARHDFLSTALTWPDTSGMTLVVPACKILGLPELPSLEEKRAQAEAMMVRGPESGAVEE
jgi:hypothetical protein